MAHSKSRRGCLRRRSIIGQRQGEQPQRKWQCRRIVRASGAGREGKVNLNSADVTLRKTLPSIGDSRARAIVSHREANGDFASIDALLEVDGIGMGIIDNIRGLITVE